MLNSDKKDLKVISGQAKKVILLDLNRNKNLNLKSLTACAKYFRDIGFKTTGNTP